MTDTAQAQKSGSLSHPEPHPCGEGFFPLVWPSPRNQAGRECLAQLVLDELRLSRKSRGASILKQPPEIVFEFTLRVLEGNGAHEAHRWLAKQVAIPQRTATRFASHVLEIAQSILARLQADAMMRLARNNKGGAAPKSAKLR